MKRDLKGFTEAYSGFQVKEREVRWPRDFHQNGMNSPIDSTTGVQIVHGLNTLANNVAD